MDERELSCRQKTVSCIERLIKEAEAEDVAMLPVWETLEALKSALEVIREMEPAEPVRNDIGIGYWYQCGACGAALGVDVKYCHDCGRMVKW